jgi:hypothetical protein
MRLMDAGAMAWRTFCLGSAFAVAGCAILSTSSYTNVVKVEGNDSSGIAVRIQTESDATPRIVNVPFEEEWGWNIGCYRAKIQRTVQDPSDQGELKVVITFDSKHQEVRRTALLMGVINLELCFDFYPYDRD